MALMHTPEKDSNFYAPDFTLKNIDDKMVAWNDCTGENGTLVMFICNHCPYVKAIVERMVADCNALQGKGIGCVAIMPNDTQNYPADSFENMKIFATDNSFTFPYLIDETQEVAKAYDAVCTLTFLGSTRVAALNIAGVWTAPPPEKQTTVRSGNCVMRCSKSPNREPARPHKNHPWDALSNGDDTGAKMGLAISGKFFNIAPFDFNEWVQN